MKKCWSLRILIRRPWNLQFFFCTRNELQTSSVQDLSDRIARKCASRSHLHTIPVQTRKCHEKATHKVHSFLDLPFLALYIEYCSSTQRTVSSHVVLCFSSHATWWWCHAASLCALCNCLSIGVDLGGIFGWSGTHSHGDSILLGCWTSFFSLHV